MSSSYSEKKARRKVSVTTLVPRLPSTGFDVPAQRSTARRAFTAPGDLTPSDSWLAPSTSRLPSTPRRRWTSSTFNQKPISSWHRSPSPPSSAPPSLQEFYLCEPFNPAVLDAKSSAKSSPRLPRIPAVDQTVPSQSHYSLDVSKAESVSEVVVPNLIIPQQPTQISSSPKLIEPMSPESPINFWCGAEFYAKMVGKGPMTTLEAKSSSFPAVRGDKIQPLSSGRLKTGSYGPDPNSVCLERIQSSFIDDGSSQSSCASSSSLPIAPTGETSSSSLISVAKTRSAQAQTQKPPTSRPLPPLPPPSTSALESRLLVTRSTSERAFTHSLRLRNALSPQIALPISDYRNFSVSEPPSRAPSVNFSPQHMSSSHSLLLSA